MINKENLWFVTLFSLIIVLSIYYISIPDNLLKNITSNTSTTNSTSTVSNINESSALIALRVEADEETLKEIQTLEDILIDNTKTVVEKNDAYEQLLEVNINKGKEEELESLIKNEFKFDSFVKIDGNNINIVISSSTHTPEIANNIIRKVQEKFDTKKYITVKFQ